MIRPNADRGSATLELAVLSLGLLAVVSLVIVLGRFQIASHAVDDAARSAARQASITRTAEAAQQQAHGAAEQTLSAQGLQCADMSVDLDTTGLSKAAGQAAVVTATVRCQVELADAALPGMPGSRTVERTFTSPVDSYREEALGFVNSEAWSRSNPSSGGAA